MKELESINTVDFEKIDAIVTEWSYRCEKGYPDLDNPNDILILKNILKEMNIPISKKINEESPVVVEKTTTPTEDPLNISAQDLASLLVNGKYSDKILRRIQVLLSRTDETIESIESSLEIVLGPDAQRAEDIIDIMLDGKTDQVKLAAYMQNRTISFNEFNSPTSILKVFSQTGLSGLAIEKLSMYRWPSTPVIGGAEVLLAVLLDGGERPSSGTAGDLIVNGQVFEVKGRGARLKAQSGYGSPKSARDGWKSGYSVLVKEYQTISLSGGAKLPDDYLNVVLPDVGTEYGSDQMKGWVTVIEAANNAIITGLSDIESLDVLKSKLAIAIGTGFSKVYENLQSTDFEWIANFINDDGTLNRREFYRQFAIESFDYYINSVSEKPAYFVITNMTEGSKKPKLENANILIFPANKESFAKHVLSDIGIVLPTFSDSAGVQGTTIGLNLGTVNKF